jgi:hypothetical protein
MARTGNLEVPIVFVGDTQVVGFDRQRLEAVLEAAGAR